MKPLSLIIVEDSLDDTLLILHELKRGGFNVEHLRVETSEELSSAMAKREWDLLICDHNLPEFNAPAALEIIKSCDIDIPFIIVSNMIGEEVAVEAMRAGAHDYILKNNLARLVPVVRRALFDANVRLERKKAEQALQESEERFRRLADNAQDLIYRIKLHPVRSFEYVSPSSLKIIGYTPEEHYADPELAFRIVHPEDKGILESMSKGKTKFAKPLVIRWVHKSGSTVWVEQRNVPLHDDSGKLVAIEGIARDITDRVINEQKLKTSHAQIEALSNRVLEAMEEERARLSRELHDELGQALTAVKLDLQLLQDTLNFEKKEDDTLKQSINLVDYTIDIVRRQSVSLRPPVLDDLGLIPALENMIKGFKKRTGIDMGLITSNLPSRLPGHLETALYRCIQESLTNIARHARAENAFVKIKNNNRKIFVSVTDDGVGFEPDKLTVSSEHIGLTGIQERIRLLGGRFKVESAPERGTKIFIIVPWELNARGAITG